MQKSMQKSILSVEINLHRKNLCSSFSLGFMHFAKLILLCLADFTETPTLQKASGNYCHNHVNIQSFQGTLKQEVKFHKGTEQKRNYILLKLLFLSLSFFIVTETPTMKRHLEIAVKFQFPITLGLAQPYHSKEKQNQVSTNIKIFA